jgi:hypothetical protein
MPAVRKILADTGPDGYRIQSIILGIVSSYPFRYRNDAVAGDGLQAVAAKDVSR